MRKLDIMNNMGRTLHKVGFKLKKHSPEILIAVGVTGTVVSAVMACKATTKISGILEKTKENVDTIHYAVEHPDELSAEYTQEDAKKDLAIVYTQTGLQLAKLYAPAVVLGAVSITCILTSHNILRKRNLALAAAYATEHLGFKEYRNRVVERFGKELDRELKYNIKAEEIEETVTNEDGTTSTVKKTVMVADDPNAHSEYSRFFDDGCKGWTKDSEYNLMFLTQTQNFANEKLKAQGYLFLNDVYDMLGIPRSKAGQIVGWIYDEKNPIGDNFVDFGFFDTNRKKAREFVNGYERVVLLDFNVDGNILELMA